MYFVFIICFRMMIQMKYVILFKALHNIGVTKETVVDVRRDQEGGTDASRAQKLG